MRRSADMYRRPSVVRSAVDSEMLYRRMGGVTSGEVESGASRLDALTAYVNGLVLSTAAHGVETLIINSDGQAIHSNGNVLVKAAA
jgi:hypothetical protein